MEPPYPSMTPTWHNSIYDAIDPSRPELLSYRKTVVITGAGSGIGRATAHAFHAAGASHIALLGRSASSLHETASELHAATQDTLVPSALCHVTIHPVSVTDAASLRAVAAEIGPWHVLILNAAYLSHPEEAQNADVDEWWQSFETNIKGALLTTQAFLPRASSMLLRLHPDPPSPASAVVPIILSLTTGAVSFPRSTTLGHSAYTASKLAQACLFEFVAAENPGIMVASVHPGMVATGMAEKAGMLDGRYERPMDDVKLPAHFLVWMASPEARFLRGRCVWANWDVGELIERSSEIEQDKSFLTAGMVGWDRLEYRGGK